MQVHIQIRTRIHMKIQIQKKQTCITNDVKRDTDMNLNIDLDAATNADVENNIGIDRRADTEQKRT